ncbi:MAG: hypothetical protein OEW30_18790 [Acidimicrobiia bacterium]|nr:hypothetical protein [Acidimicrobiia bacterium]
MVTVVTRVRTDADARLAWAVGSHPSVGKTGMLGRKPPPSWRDVVVPAAALPAPDIVVDPDPTDPGLVVTRGPSDRPGITFASPEGLARALTARLGGSATPSWTVPGAPLRAGESRPFPEPVGHLWADDEAVPCDSQFAAAGAFTTDHMVVTVDDRDFLDTVCLAAGVVVCSLDISSPTPVWEYADRYVEACESLGLVFAEADLDDPASSGGL